MNKKGILISFCMIFSVLFIILNCSLVYAGCTDISNDNLTVKFTDSTTLTKSFAFTVPSARLYINDTDSSIDTQDLLSYFRSCTENFSEYIDLYDYGLSADKFDYIYRMLVYCSPRSYYLLNNNGSYQYYTYCDPIKNIVYGVTPVYQLDIYDECMDILPEKLNSIQEEVDDNLNIFDSEIDTIKSCIVPGMTDIEKLIAFHNYMNLNYNYSYEDYSGDQSAQGHNTAMLLARDKKGMCLAFSTLFSYVAESEGIDTGFVLSYATDGTYTSEYHIWNLINIESSSGGEKKWYHVDVAWDDTLSRGYGSCRLDYFLLSDELIRPSHEFSSGNYNVFYDITDIKTGSDFDYAQWRYSVSPIVTSNRKWYFVSYDSSNHKSILYEYDARSAADTAFRQLYSFNDKWYTSFGSSASYSTSYSGLGLVNGKLYFNGPKNIYSYSLNSGTVNVEFSLSKNDTSSIYSCYSDGSSIYYGIKPDGSGQSDPVIKGGSISVADVAVTASPIIDGKVYININPSDLYESENEIQVFVVSDSTLSEQDCDSLQENLLSFEVGSSQTAKVFIWDSNMRPLTECCTVSQ